MDEFVAKVFSPLYVIVTCLQRVLVLALC